MGRAEFNLLGPLEIRVASTALELSSGRQRALLALLLLARGRAVPTEELVVSLYGDETPSNARHALHELVSNLRRSLEPTGLDTLLESARGSYRFVIEPRQLDAFRFEALLADAQGAKSLEVRSRTLRQALQLWRGPALADVEIEGVARAEVERLKELRAAAQADWLDLELDAGRYRAAIGELERAAAADPYNERLRGQLMLALYQDGRQAEALRVYQDVRRLLAHEMGLEPTEELRALERKILNHDSDLRPRRVASWRRPGRRLGRRNAATLAALVVVCAGVAAAANALATGRSSHAVFVDRMKGREIDTMVWDVQSAGDGPTEAADGDGTHLTIPAHATPDATGALRARISTYCMLAGGFDIQVDYDLATWPHASGVGLGLYAAYADVMRESTSTGDYYVGARRTIDPPDGTPRSRLKTDDASGTLRLVRDGNRMLLFARTSGEWRTVYAFPNPTTAAVPVYIELYTTDRRFSHRQVEARLTNFRVNSGFLQCP